MLNNNAISIVDMNRNNYKNNRIVGSFDENEN